MISPGLCVQVFLSSYAWDHFVKLFMVLDDPHIKLFYVIDDVLNVVYFLN